MRCKKMPYQNRLYKTHIFRVDIIYYRLKDHTLMKREELSSVWDSFWGRKLSLSYGINWSFLYFISIIRLR